MYRANCKKEDSSLSQKVHKNLTKQKIETCNANKTGMTKEKKEC